jgi:hypothetical protein
MLKVMNFYLDDSGTRHPDHKPGKKAAHGYDWFAMGGIIIKDEDETVARDLHKKFCDKWNISDPIHSVEIRGRTENFLWLEELSKANLGKFLEELYQLMRACPVVGVSCVIDRPGYNVRYAERYAGQRWMLCKSAFNISVERAAKYARSSGYRLKVFPERCNKSEDRWMKGYYDDLRTKGAPFAADTSDKYGPLTVDQFRETLYDFKIKYKSSPMVQLADLYLWPMSMGGYHGSNRPYQRLKEDGKLIECTLKPEEWPMLATKYYCFEKIVRKP